MIWFRYSRARQIIDFSTLSALEFENLIADLLTDLGLKAEREVAIRGHRFDFSVSFDGKDPFGGAIPEKWLIEVKHYSAGRLSLAIVTQFADLARSMAMYDYKTRIALVTSSQVTSAARDFIRDTPLRLVEGVELKRILLARPELVRKHFSDQHGT